MALTPEELRTWDFVTDGAPPPEEVADPAAPQKIAALRVFAVQPGDDRFPGMIAMPRLLRSAPRRIREDWLRVLVAETTGTCPSCRQTRISECPTVRHRNCPLSGFGRRVRGWLVPGSIDALAGLVPGAAR